MTDFNANITIQGKTFQLPPVSTEQYLEYCDVREPIAADDHQLYTRADFYAMADQLVKLYGNQFSRGELLGPGGLTPGEVIVQFTMIEMTLMKQVDASVAELRENFTSGT